MKFTTETGSMYEVNDTQIRRLAGAHAPTSRQGPDGEWKSFAAMGGIVIGEPVAVVWEVDPFNMILRSTVTSVVKSIEA